MLRLATLAAAVAGLALAASAGAKLTRVTVSTPSATTPRKGVPWTVTVHVSLRGKPYPKPGYRPTLYLISKRIPVATFHGVAIGEGTFRVRIVFPRPGTWRYVIPDPVNGEWWFGSPRVAP